MEKQKFISYEVKPILEVCDFEKGTEPGSRSYNREGFGIPFIRVGNIGAQIQEQIYTTSENIKLCNKEDILITLDGTPGIVIRGIEGAYASGIRKVIVKDPNILLRDFVYYFLQINYVQKIIKQHSTGITIQHASKALKYIEIPIPPLEIQKKIVSILDTIQKAVEIQDGIIEKTKELKKSLMADLFKYGGPSFRKNRKLKKTEIGEIPEDWEVVRLGEIYGIRKKPKEIDIFNYSQIPFVKMEDIGIYDNKINWELRTPNKINTNVYFEKGDLLLAKITPCLENGKQAIANNLPLNFGLATTEIIPLYSKG
ncbi:MAG: restriction endonuclease subunit S, partial [Candidatus Aenigmatarchaeota archaeon]